jgi:hypothetical protein
MILLDERGGLFIKEPVRQIKKSRMPHPVKYLQTTLEGENALGQSRVGQSRSRLTTSNQRTVLEPILISSSP